MNSPIPAQATVQFMHLKKEAAIEPTPVSTAPVTKETQIIAIYGKGGIDGVKKVVRVLEIISEEELKSLTIK